MISHLVEPFDNFFILPNNFFVFILDFLGERNNSSSILKVLLYLLKHAWRKTTGNKHIRFSFRICEIQNGIKRGKRFVDRGTGLSPNSIRSALKTLIKKGIVKVVTRKKHKEYYLVIHESEEESRNGDFSAGWPAPKTSYFKVPNSFTDGIVDVDNPTSILTMLYKFRHSWGFQNKDGVFMSVDEISNGRKKTDGSRYDSGIGIHKSSIYRAIIELIDLGWVTWTDRGFKSPDTKLYNLHLEHHRVDVESGEYLGRLPWENDQDYEFFSFRKSGQI